MSKLDSFKYHNFNASKANNHRGVGCFGLAVIAVLVSIGLLWLAVIRLSIGGFGPQAEVDATVTSKYVDYGHDQDSHYMVCTDIGVFEVDNGPVLWIWNADEIYAQFQPGKRYHVTTKGKRVVNIFFQEYLYIIAGKEIKQ